MKTRRLEERRAAWRACLVPGDDVEERLVDTAVVHTWMQDRAWSSQAARLDANLALFGADQAEAEAKQVEELGSRLFKDREGPLAFYPSLPVTEHIEDYRDETTSYPAVGRDDPDRPGAILVALQSTLTGCEWPLGAWARLREILEKAQAWISSDQFKAVRLLGKQPFDAIDDRDVAMVFLASFALKPDTRSWYWEISMELAGPDIKRFRKNAGVRQLDLLEPRDAAGARVALIEVIDRARERLTKKADALRARAGIMQALAPDLLAFDESTAGERLRRYDLASGRGLSRALEDLRKHRSALSVVRGPWSVAGGEAALLPAVGGPLSVVGGEAEVGEMAEADLPAGHERENAPNEPN